MTVSTYESYKNSGVDWLGEIPAHWLIGKFRHLFTESSEKIDSEIHGEMLSVSGYRGVELKEYSDENQKRTEDNLIGYRIVHEGQLVVNTMWLNYAGLGVSQLEGHVSPAYRSYWINSSLHKPFVHYLMRSGLYVLGYTKYLTGVRPNSLQMGRDDLMSFPILIPTLDEQKSIANFLDHETAKIDALVAKQDNLIDLLKTKLDSLVLESFNNVDTQIIKLRNAVEVINRPVTQIDGKFYEPLGLFNRGRGLFHKEKRTATDMGDSDFFWVKEGDLIISGQFAWEGAVALAYKEEEGCVVSHRYPLIKGKAEIVLTEYLFALLTTDHGNFLLNQSSVGAAGRNRPLNINLLLKEAIPIPNIKTQEKIAEIVLKRRNLLREIHEQTKLINERRSALISAAVTGQIDVRNYQLKEIA